MSIMSHNYIQIKEASEQLGCSRTTLEVFERRGRIPRRELVGMRDRAWPRTIWDEWLSAFRANRGNGGEQ